MAKQSRDDVHWISHVRSSSKQWQIWQIPFVMVRQSPEQIELAGTALLRVRSIYLCSFALKWSTLADLSRFDSWQQQQSCLNGEIAMRHASFICLLVVISGFFIQLVKSSFFPYMTCPGCETFLSCFFKCPRKIYPGINRYVLHNPKTTANHPFLIVHQHFFSF